MTEKTLIPGLEGIPCAASSVSFIDGIAGILEYRGYDITTLANHGTFEEVAYLLLYGELPKKDELVAFDAELRANRVLKYPVLDIIKSLPSTGHPMKAIQAGVAVLGAFYPVGDLNNAHEQRLASVRLIAQLPTVVAAFHRARQGDEPIAPNVELNHATNFLYMLDGQIPSAVISRTLDIAMILHMEHTMNASTFTGRVVASTLADPYAVVSSAIGSLTGPLHGGANERALEELREIPSVDAVDEIITGKIERKDKIMGLGHRVYKTTDPRSTLLQGLCAGVFAERGSAEIFDIARKVEEIATGKLGHKGIFPNVDFYSGILYDAMGIPSDLFTPIFAVARVVGWLAHWKEQLIGNRIFRPTQIYVGHRQRPFTPMSDR